MKPGYCVTYGWTEKCPRVKQIKQACDKLGAWMSAALEDDKVCEEMKTDIREWFKILESGE